MKISIMGLGYVGVINSACLANMGHDVIGVDIKQEKVDKVNKGISPVYEQNLDDMVLKVVSNGKLSATTDMKSAILNTDLSLICVGTPCDSAGYLNKSALLRVTSDMGDALKDKETQHIFIYRSTMLPGTTKEMASIISNNSGKERNKDFFMCMNPEFLREGQAIKDFYEPEKIVVGHDDDFVKDVIKDLYIGFDSTKMFFVPIEVAESVKYADNIFHALKICFANEIDSFCELNGVDGHKVMDIFKSDKKLNISEKYLTPGFCFGGSCLPKDVAAVSGFSMYRRLPLPLINAIKESNNSRYEQFKKKLDSIIDNYDNPVIGFIGTSFKPMTDDLRESKVVEMVGAYKQFFKIMVYDDFVPQQEMEKVFGTDCQYTQNIDELLSKSDIIVFNHLVGEDIIYDGLKPEQSVLDLNSSLNSERVESKYVK